MKIIKRKLQEDIERILPLMRSRAWTKAALTRAAATMGITGSRWARVYRAILQDPGITGRHFYDHAAQVPGYVVGGADHVARAVELIKARDYGEAMHPELEAMPGLSAVIGEYGRVGP